MGEVSSREQAQGEQCWPAWHSSWARPLGKGAAGDVDGLLHRAGTTGPAKITFS